MKKGLIIVGFPGIGKSTLAKNIDNVIDLESSWFPKVEGWANTYCTVANELCAEGFIVCVSSHAEVRKALVEQYAQYQNLIVLIYPSVCLYDDWIIKLEDRYNNTGLEKDARALNYMRNNYFNAVQEMEDTYIQNSTVFDRRELKSIDYDLKGAIYLKKRNGQFYIDQTKQEVLNNYDPYNAETFLSILEKLDYPFVKYYWDRILNNLKYKKFALTKYISYMNLCSFREYTWKDSDLLNKRSQL